MHNENQALEECMIADGLAYSYTIVSKNINEVNEKCNLYYRSTKQDEVLVLELQRIKEGAQTSNMVLPCECIMITISKNYIFQYLHSFHQSEMKENNLLQFTVPKNFIASIDICKQSHELLNTIILLNKNSAINKVLLCSYVLHLLVLSISNITQDPNIVTDKNETFDCKFLANEEGREKIYLAEKYIITNLGTPFTIKELSKLVAINECYLKKGFKEIFGKTVNEYYQTKRMLHAKELLYNQGLSVTEIASILGFSSISHFSTAFKKHTGIKPCELLMR